MSIEVYKKPNISQAIFQSVNASIDFGEGVFHLVDHPEYQPEGFLEYVELLEADADGFYYRPDALINKYFYYKDYFHYDFFTFNLFIEREMLAMDTHLSLAESPRFKSQREWALKTLEKDISLYVQLVDKKFRFKLFIELFDRIPDKEKFDTFMAVYTQGEFGFGVFTREFIERVVAYRHLSEEEVPLKTEFPEIKGEYITIYRGATPQSTPIDKAYSWTMDKKVARYFATRWGEKGTIYQGRVKIDKIISHYDGRNEKEILVFPEDVTHITKIK
jgi:hypothetical protein